MVADNMTRGSCIPTDSVKSGDDCSNLIYILGLGHILIRIRPIQHTWLVKVMICRVDNIRIKRDRGEVWITIFIGIIVIAIHITKMSITKNKQRNKEKST